MYKLYKNIFFYFFCSCYMSSMINALLNNSRVRQLIDREYENCELLKLFKQFLANPDNSWDVTLVKQVLHDFVENHNQQNPTDLLGRSLYFGNRQQQDSQEFFEALIRTSKPLMELFAFETKKCNKCQKCDTPLFVSDKTDQVHQLNLMSNHQEFSTKTLILESRNVPSDIPCKTCHPRRLQPEVNLADSNEIFASLPEILFLTVNSWEIVAPFLKKSQTVKPSPKIWIGEKVYVLRSIIQHHGVSKGTQIYIYIHFSFHFIIDVGFFGCTYLKNTSLYCY